MKKIFNIIVALLLICCNATFAQMPGGGQPPMGGQGGPGMGGPGMGGPGGKGKPMNMPGDMKQQKKQSKKNSEVREAGTMYIYGIALNPSDSVVYVTDELMLKDAQIYKKTKFLVNRDEYSEQLKTYMASKDEKNRTCAVRFDRKIKSLDKKYKKQMAYFKKRGYLIQSVDQTAFQFNTVRKEFDMNAE